MKCKQCGAEINSDAKICEYCGSHISSDMRREQEQLNKQGCPKCGSGNITFKRENQGEVRGKKSKQVIHRTVGVCKDCGNTWFVDNAPAKKKTWLWVLGWLFIFPVPLTILLLRKKDMKPLIKYGIIAIAWIAYLVIAFCGGGNSSENPNSTVETTTEISISSSADSEDTSANETTITKDSEKETVIELVAGEAGEYGKEIIMSAGTDAEEKMVVYYVPAGKYTVKNLGDHRTQVNVYEGIVKNEKTGYDEYTNSGDIALLDENGEDEIEVPDGWFIEIHDAHIMLIEK